jgi:hypothetical protein
MLGSELGPTAADDDIAIGEGIGIRIGHRGGAGRMSAFGGIVLQKSFCLTDHKFSGLWARRSNIDVGDRFIL